MDAGGWLITRWLEVQVQKSGLGLPGVGQALQMVAQHLCLARQLVALKLAQTAGGQLATESEAFKGRLILAGVLDPLMPIQRRGFKGLGIRSGGVWLLPVDPQPLAHVGVNRVTQPAKQFLKRERLALARGHG